LLCNRKGVDDKGNYKAEALKAYKAKGLKARKMCAGGNARHGWQVEKIDQNIYDEAIEYLQQDFVVSKGSKPDVPGEEKKLQNPKAQFLWRSIGHHKPPVGFPEIMLEEPLDKDMKYQYMLVEHDNREEELKADLSNSVPNFSGKEEKIGRG
jgi:hypothetical protein